MKNIFLPITFVGFFLLPLACASLLPTPQVEDVARSQVLWPDLQLMDLQKGRNLYLKNCAGCHALHVPSEFDKARWEKTIIKMQVKAKIDDGTRDQIMKYLLTYSKQD